MSPDRETPDRDIRIIIGMLLCVAVPTALTHATIKVPVRDMHMSDNPTPLGYTVSLLLFIVPVLVIARWHLSRGNEFDRRAFLWSGTFMAGVGALLDILFGSAFFEFKNRGAVLGPRLPAWSWKEMGWIPGYLPIEEFAFYILGAVFMASVYLWACENWVSAYGRPDYDEGAKAHPRIIQLSPVAVGVWAAIMAAGLGYRALHGGGVPGYFVFIMTAGVLPTVLLIRTVKEFVNWHGMVFSFFSLVFVSVIWEASLAVPYSWWSYKSEQMLGIFIHGWSDLPFEAVMVWTIGVWDAVLIYECFRVFFRMQHEPRHRLLGVPSAGAT
jgi:hypothetical protein